MIIVFFVDVFEEICISEVLDFGFVEDDAFFPFQSYLSCGRTSAVEF